MIFFSNQSLFNVIKESKIADELHNSKLMIIFNNENFHKLLNQEGSPNNLLINHYFIEINCILQTINDNINKMKEDLELFKQDNKKI